MDGSRGDGDGGKKPSRILRAFNNAKTAAKKLGRRRNASEIGGGAAQVEGAQPGMAPPPAELPQPGPANIPAGPATMTQGWQGPPPPQATSVGRAAADKLGKGLKSAKSMPSIAGPSRERDPVEAFNRSLVDQGIAPGEVVYRQGAPDPMMAAVNRAVFEHNMANPDGHQLEFARNVSRWETLPSGEQTAQQTAQQGTVLKLEGERPANADYAIHVGPRHYQVLNTRQYQALEAARAARGRRPQTRALTH